MKKFNEKFKNDLYQLISEIEDNSMVEVVSIIRDNSDRYRDVALRWAAILTGINYTLMMIIPFDINVYIMYLATILGFIFLFYFIMNFKGLLRFLTPKKRMEKEIEIISRAIFQKGGIRFTKEKIGVLFFISYFERKVKILPDRGAKLAIPSEEWEKMQEKFDQAISETDVAEAIIKALRNTILTFKTYIPSVENDINELPDNVEIDF